MEPRRGFGPRSALLPYEVDICQNLGLTAEEYLEFFDAAYKYVEKRKEEYELIPDVRNEPTTILVNIVIGIALTAISAALAPKPKTPKEKPRLDIPSEQGRTRYAKSSDFNGVQQLATLGRIIPLVFADQTKANGITVGGIRIDTDLVHSQLTSLGTNQVFAGILNICLGKLAVKPDFDGFALGDLLLRDFSKYKLQLYFSNKSRNNRITKEDKYDRSKLELVSDSSETDRFSVIAHTSPNSRSFQPWFSGTRTPSTNTQFGAYSPLSNGHMFYIPYELIIVPDDGGNRNKKIAKAKRKKVITPFPRYSGITKITGNTATYTVGNGSISKDDYDFRDWGVKDVNSTINESRIRADEILQVTELFLIGDTLATCVERPDDIWQDQVSTNFEYKFNTESRVPASMRIDDLRETDPNDGDTFFPWDGPVVMKAAIGSIANSRPCNITEIGIKSEVWRQMTNSANFQEHPSLETVQKYDEDGGQITLGTVTKYIKRWTFFKLEGRALGAENWLPLTDSPFAICGSTPVSQYNTIAIRHPDADPISMHEYRFIPVPGSNFYSKVLGNVSQSVQVYRLDGGNFWNTRSDRNTIMLNGYFVDYTGRTENLTVDDFTNKEWIFGGNALPITTGPLAALDSNSVGDGIPTYQEWVVKLSKREYSEEPFNERMVLIGPTVERQQWIWNGAVIATTNNQGQTRIQVEENGKLFRYTREQLVRPFLPQEFVPSPPGERLEFDNEDVTAGTSDTVGFTPYYGVVKKSTNFYQYWWAGRLVATANNKNGRATDSTDASIQYEASSDCRGNTTSFVDDPLNQNQYNKSALNTLITGAKKVGDQTYDFYYRGSYLGRGRPGFVYLKVNSNPAEGRWRIDTLKQNERKGEFKYVGKYRDIINNPTVAADASVVNGIYPDSNGQWNWFFFGKRIAGPGTSNPNQGPDGTVIDEAGNRYSRDIVTSPAFAGPGVEYPEPSQQLHPVWFIERSEPLTNIEELWSVSFKYKVVTPEICSIKRFALTAGQEGKYGITKEVFTTFTVDPIEPTGELAPVIPVDRIDYEEADLATVRMYRYPSPDDINNIVYATWQIETKGDSYVLDECVQFGLDGMGIPSNFVRGILAPTTGETTTEDYEEFIREDRNYFQLNALSDYFINNTDRSSHQDNPENEIVFVNEIIPSDDTAGPQFNDLAICGLKLTNSKEWSNLSNLSTYIKKGVEVERLFARDGINAGERAQTNLFPEIAYALLTDKLLGAGTLIGAESVDKDAMVLAAQFCKANGFYWDGVIGQEQNLREFIFEQAAYCMLDFTVKGGRFGLYPSVPFGKLFKINANKKPEIKALFTDGNMSGMEVAFLEPEERQAFQAAVLYRQETTNGFPQTRTKIIRINDQSSDPVEQFDLTQFCTNEEQAIAFGKFALAVRTLITHGIKFQTTPNAAAGLQPGEYIRVATTVTHLSQNRSGSIDPTGYIQSSATLGVGTFPIVYWSANSTAVKETSLTVTSRGAEPGPCTNQSVLYNSLWCEMVTTSEKRIYKVETISFSDDGLIEISASEAPLNETTGGLATLDWVNDPDLYEVIG